MKTIHKHVIPFGSDGLILNLAQGYRLLKAEYLPYSKVVSCWLEVPTDPRLPKEQVELRLFNTGDGIPKVYEYVDTAVNSLDPEAWHLYQLRVAHARVVA